MFAFVIISVEWSRLEAGLFLLINQIPTHLFPDSRRLPHLGGGRRIGHKDVLKPEKVGGLGNKTIAASPINQIYLSNLKQTIIPPNKNLIFCVCCLC
ncbi:MAG: hypothetical protein ABSE68_02435 [Minisyncoccia bacterium]